MQNKRDMIISVFMIFTGIGVIIWSTRLQVGTLLGPKPGSFPFLVGFMTIVLSIFLLIKTWSGRSKTPRSYGNWKRPAIMVAGLAVYTATLESLGYVLSTIFIAALTLRIMGVTSWKVISISSLVVSFGIYFFFTRIMGVEIPAGIMTFLV